MVKVLLLLLLSAFVKRTFADATNALVMSIPHHKPVGDSELHCDFFLCRRDIWLPDKEWTNEGEWCESKV